MKKLQCQVTPLVQKQCIYILQYVKYKMNIILQQVLLYGKNKSRTTMFKVVISYNDNYKLLKNCMIILNITDNHININFRQLKSTCRYRF